MSEENLKIDVNRKDSFKVISLTGRLDSYNVQQFRDVAIDAIKEEDIVLDLSKLEFIASIGIGNFMELADNAEKYNKKLFLLGVQPNVFNVLKMTGFLTMFKLINSFDEIS